MKEKKMCGIGAVVLMLLVAIVPAINGMQLSTGEMNDFENELGTTNTAIYDLVLTVDVLEFDRYEEVEDEEDYMYAFYTLTYTVTNVGFGPFFGYIHTVARKDLKQYGEWDEGWYWIKRDGGHETFTHTIKIKASDIDSIDKERGFSAKDIVVETVKEDEAGIPDPTPGDNAAIKFSTYWKTSSSYRPSKTHIDLTLPCDAWIDHYEEYDIGGETIDLPEYKAAYASALASLFGSNRMGWLWDLAYNVTNFTIALLYFVAEFLEVLADIVLILVEIEFLLSEVTAFFNPMMLVPPVYPGPLEIAAFLVTLSVLALTIAELLEDIQDLPIHPDDPERKRLEAAGQELESFLASQPWYDDVIIEGEVHKVKDDEQLTVKCREESWSVEENGDPTEFGPFSVPTNWAPGDMFIFRNCQITVTGNGHTGQKLKTPRLLSYVAPGGYLDLTCAFKKKSRNLSRESFLQRLSEIFPFLTQILPLLFFDRHMNEI